MALVSLENLTRFYAKLKEKMYLKTEVDTKLSGKANSSHTHSYNDLSNKPSIPSALSPYPVGSVYFSVNNTNPANYFGGTWVQIGTKLAVSENVFGNGKALALTQGSQWGVLIGADAAYVKNWTGQGIGGGTTVGPSFNRNNQALGVPTKASLGSDLSNSGLIVDTVTIYSWKRTA